MRGLKLGNGNIPCLSDLYRRAVCPANEGIETTCLQGRVGECWHAVARSAPLMRGLKPTVLAFL